MMTLFDRLWRNRWMGVFLGSAVVASVAAGNSEPGPTALPMLEWFEPAPALIDYAKSVGIPTEGLADPTDQPGVPRDSAVVALIVHQTPAKTQQWLVHLIVRDLTEKEKRTTKLPEARYYTSTGNEVTLTGTPAAVAIRVVGPIAVGGPVRARPRKPKDVWSGAIVNDEFLRLGLHRASVVVQRLSEDGAARGTHGGFGWQTTPFPPEEITNGRRTAEAIGLALEDEHALVGSFPALVQFFLIAASTPGVRDVLREMLDLGIWSLVSKGVPSVYLELLAGMERVELPGWGIPSDEPRRFPFVLKISDEPRLTCSAAVIPPRAPYVTSAGIVGLAVQRVDDPTSRVVLRVIASRAAGASAAAE